MSRAIVTSERQKINVWILNNQIRDVKKAKQVTGKTITAIIGEALALWLAHMRKEGVL